MPDLCFSEIRNLSDEGLKEMLEGEAEKMFGVFTPEGDGRKKADASGFHARFVRLEPSRVRLLYEKIAALICRFVELPQHGPP